MKKIEDIARIIENKKVVLYGAGKYGVIALNNIKKYYDNVNVCYYIDDNKVRNPKPVDGIDIVAIDEIAQSINEYEIIITNFYVNQTAKRLENVKVDLNKVHFWSALLIEDVCDEVLSEHKADFDYILNELGDYKSKLIYKNLIECRSSMNMDVLTRTCDLNQYFPQDIIKVTDNEVFVDGGAFDGDTSRQFIDYCGGKYERIYAFEPDKTNHNDLVNNAGDRRVVIFNGGLYDKTTTLSFAGDKGGSSKITDDGEDRINVYALDEMDLPHDKITFVKMDIEGSELKALQGMQQIIAKNKPKLAICIYHKFEDLWEIPLFIKSIVPDYKLYIRNYTTYLDEVVLYATI